MKKIRDNNPIKRKRPLCQDNLKQIVSALPNPSYDDQLFIAMTFTVFFGLLCLSILMPDPFQLDPELEQSEVLSILNLFPNHLIPFVHSLHFHLPLGGSTKVVELDPPHASSGC